MRRPVRNACVTVTLLVGSSLALGDAPLEKVGENVQAQDLANLASALGVQFEIFDYDPDEAHCVRFFVDEIGEGNTARHDVQGLCGLAGPQRLTVQWKKEEGQARVRFMRYRRDSEQGASFGGPTLTTATQSGFTEYSIEAPQLDYDRETVLFHGAFGQNQGPRTEFKVLAELRPNPRQTVGTE